MIQEAKAWKEVTVRGGAGTWTQVFWLLATVCHYILPQHIHSKAKQILKKLQTNKC